MKKPASFVSRALGKMPKTVKDPKTVKKAAEKKQTEPDPEVSELDAEVSEPAVQNPKGPMCAPGQHFHSGIRIFI